MYCLLLVFTAIQNISTNEFINYICSYFFQTYEKSSFYVTFQIAFERFALDGIDR